MSKVDLFEVLIRTIGFIVFLRGVMGLYWMVLGLSRAVSFNSKYPPRAWIARVAAYLVASVVLMGLAEGIARTFSR